MSARALRVVAEQPRTRGECAGGPRPCPWSACRYHLESATDTCALDVADRGGVTLQQVGELIGVSQPRVYQIADSALRKARRRARWLGFSP